MQGSKLIRTCSIWRALEIVGDTSTLLIIEASWLGARRFDDFWRMTGLLKALLSNRMKRLVDAQLMEKRLYSTAPPRYDYVLTTKGRDLYGVSLLLLRWELKWGAQADKIKLTLTHRTCGKTFLPQPSCRECLGEIDVKQTEWAEGPGVGWMAPLYSRRRQQRASSESSTMLFDQSAQLMGDRWASLIMRAIFTGLNRFDEIHRDTGMATNILAERLGWLTEIGVIRQVQYAAGPARFEYRGTRKGFDYFPALLLLMQWGDKYYVSPEGPPLLLTHKGCGHALETVVVCSECHKALVPEDVVFELIRPAEDVAPDAPGKMQPTAL